MLPSPNYFGLLFVFRQRLKGNADDDERAEQPAEKIKLEDVENNENDQAGEQVRTVRYSVIRRNVLIVVL